MKKIVYTVFIMLSLPIFTSCGRIFDSLVDLLIEDKNTRETVKEAASIAKEIGKETASVAKEVGKEVMSMETKTVELDPLDGFKIVTIEKRGICGKSDPYKFPRIEYKDKYVERKVNAMLQLSIFGVLFNDDEGNGIDGINHFVRCAHGRDLPPTRFYDHSFSRNIAIRIATVSSRHSGDASFYNFNPKTGDLYHLEDFFDEAAYYEFQSIVLGYEVTEKNDLANLSQFEISPNQIFMCVRPRKSMRISDYKVINISEIEHLLNDYGRAALITGEGLDNFESYQLPMLYEGNIGDEPVIFLRTHPFHVNNDALFFLKSGKYCNTNEEDIELLNKPYQKSEIVQAEDKLDIDICDKYWYDCPMGVEQIDKIDPQFESKANCSPAYLYNDYGVDLFCYRVTSDHNLEGFYQIPYPLGHDNIVCGDYVRIKDNELYYKDRIDEFGVKPQKYQVKLKKM